MGSVKSHSLNVIACVYFKCPSYQSSGNVEYQRFKCFYVVSTSNTLYICLTDEQEKTERKKFHGLFIFSFYSMSQLSQAAITKYHSWDGFNKRIHFLGGWKSEIRVVA